jgi:hypothetical protein
VWMGGWVGGWVGVRVGVGEKERVEQSLPIGNFQPENPIPPLVNFSHNLDCIRRK